MSGFRCATLRLTRLGSLFFAMLLFWLLSGLSVMAAPGAAQEHMEPYGTTVLPVPARYFIDSAGTGGEGASPHGQGLTPRPVPDQGGKALRGEFRTTSTPVDTTGQSGSEERTRSMYLGFNVGIVTHYLSTTTAGIGDTAHILGLTAQQASDASYHWTLDGAMISGATAPSYVTEAEGQLAALISLGGDSYVTAPATVSTAAAPPSVTVPAQFAAPDWSLADSPSADGDRLTLTIQALPEDGGGTINNIHYRVNGGGFQNIGSALGARQITVPAGAQARVELRAVNSAGQGPWSTAKTATPTVSALVESVDLTAASGSLKFPVNNNYSAVRDDLTLTLEVPTDIGGANEMFLPHINTAGESAMVALVRLPKAQRVTFDKGFGVFGSTTARVTYLDVSENAGAGYKNRFLAGVGGRNTVSAPWTEDAALVVSMRRVVEGTSVVQTVWVSLIDGTIHYNDGSHPDDGTLATATPHPGTSWDGEETSLSIGGHPTGEPELGVTGLWPGEIGFVGFVDGDIPDAEWSRMALGADPIEVAATNGAVWKFLRKLDGTSASLTPPVAPPGAEAGVDDTTLAATVWTPAGASAPATMLPGSDLRRTADGRRLWLDTVAHPSATTVADFGDGIVVGVAAGQSSAQVRFTGRAYGLSGEVEVQVINETTGVVVQDWTSLGTVSSGAFDGTVTIAKSDGGWFATRLRAVSDPSAVFFDRTLWTVGYKIGTLGQSQMDISQGHALPGGRAMAAAARRSSSYFTMDAVTNHLDEGVYPQFHLLDARKETGGPVALVEQVRAVGDDTPIMVVDMAVSGTSMRSLIDDSDDNSDPGAGPREWSALQAKLDALGNDYTVIVHQWGTSDSSQSGDPGIDAVLDALVYGDTTNYAVDHYLDDAMQPGWAFAYSPLTRHQGGDSYVGNMNQSRVEATAWAQGNGWVVGPPVSDFRIEDAGGPHQGNDGEGSETMGARMGLAAARALGIDTSENPYFTGTATFNAGRTTITIPVTLPNGGTLYSPNPTALRSFLVNDGGGGTYDDAATAGFSAEISGNTVVLTKDSGAWSAGTEVRYAPSLENRDDNDGVAEVEIIAGALYESWSQDILGKGLPLLGTVTAGNWTPSFTTTVVDG